MKSGGTQQRPAFSMYSVLSYMLAGRYPSSRITSSLFHVDSVSLLVISHLVHIFSPIFASAYAVHISSVFVFSCRRLYCSNLALESCILNNVNGSVCLGQSVPEPIVEIVDSQTNASLFPDRVLYYRIGSSLELRCRVKHYWIKPKSFQWLKSGTPVADELWRGGIRSLKLFVFMPVSL